MNIVLNQNLKYWLKRNIPPAYKMLRSLYKYIPSNKLSTIIIEISGMCNLNCTMCSYQKWFSHKGMMTLDTLRKLDKALPKLQSITLQCNCEPLLNADIVNIVKYIKEHNQNIDVGFVTNGMLLKPIIISELLRAGINWIGISIDSSNKETFESLRTGANYDDIIENIVELINQRGTVKNKLNFVTIITVATKLNIHELMGILELANKLQVDGVAINGLEAYSEEMKDKMLYVDHDENINSEHKDIFSLLRVRAREYGLFLNLPSLQSDPQNTCVINSCVIDWNGDVSPCSILSYQRPYYLFGDELIHPKINFGNINKTDIFDIWTSNEFTNFRNDIKKGNLPQYCLKCSKRIGVFCEQ